LSEPSSTPAPEADAKVLTIWHTYESGTILGGTSKGDAASQALGHVKRGGLGWKWSSNITTPDGDFGAWYIRYSREKPSKNWEINRAVERLQGLGYRVEVMVDNTPRDMRESEADRAAHMDDRAAALANKADRQSSTAANLREQADRCFPDNGQPLLVDHYSYNADLRRRERGWKKLGQAADLSATAKYNAGRAETAQRHMDCREAPFRVARRITELEAQLRSEQRDRAGREQWHTNADGKEVFGRKEPSPAYIERCDVNIAHLENQLTYWREIRDEQIANGVATNFTKADIAKGDWVKYRNDWYVVARVNRLSVSVNTTQKRDGSGWYTDTIRLDQLQAHRTAAEVAERKAAKANAVELDEANASTGGDDNG
jgi:hypothetical protein